MSTTAPGSIASNLFPRLSTVASLSLRPRRGQCTFPDRCRRCLNHCSEWRAANRKKIEERQAKSKAELEKVLAQAEVDRKAFYEQRTKQIDVVKKSNRCDNRRRQAILARQCSCVTPASK